MIRRTHIVQGRVKFLVELLDAPCQAFHYGIPVVFRFGEKGCEDFGKKVGCKLPAQASGIHQMGVVPQAKNPLRNLEVGTPHQPSQVIEEFLLDHK